MFNRVRSIKQHFEEVLSLMWFHVKIRSSEIVFRIYRHIKQLDCLFKVTEFIMLLSTMETTKGQVRERLSQEKKKDIFRRWFTWHLKEVRYHIL